MVFSPYPAYDKSCLDEFPDWDPNKQPQKTIDDGGKKEKKNGDKKKKPAKHKPKKKVEL